MGRAEEEIPVFLQVRETGSEFRVMSLSSQGIINVFGLYSTFLLLHSISYTGLCCMYGALGLREAAIMKS